MTNLPKRFWDKVEKVDDGCWLWAAAKVGNGYAEFWTGETMRYAHRLAYEDAVGPVPAGLDLDHLCRVRHCVNPEHLEPVTRKENLRRGLGNQNAGKTHCNSGHPFDEENTYVPPAGGRQCRVCAKRRWQEWRRRQNAAESKVVAA